MTPGLLKLLGYYTAEGRENGCLEFTFGTHEPDLHDDVIAAHARDRSASRPNCGHSADNSTKIIVPLRRAGPVLRTTLRHRQPREARARACCGTFRASHFEAYLTGYALGDGYVTKEGKLSITSVSHQLIRELTWLCAMHGIPAGVREMDMPAGRVIKNQALAGDARVEPDHWQDQPLDGSRPRAPGQTCHRRSVEVKPFDGYVYDLCGCENEAFFGGEKPVLLHNSRVRDLFEQGKRNAPCLTGDTEITLSGGRQVAIRDMFERQMVGVRVPSMSEDFRLEDSTVIGITCKPSTDLFQIRTTTSSIKATGNHQFPVWRHDHMEWVRTDELQPGDHVATPRVIPTTSERPLFASLLPAEDVFVHSEDGRRPLFESIANFRALWRRIGALSTGQGGFGSSRLERHPLEISEGMAYVCGLIASDGAFGAPGDRTVQFVNTEPHLHERVREILESEFGYTPRKHLNAKHWETVLPQGRTALTLRDCWSTHINHKLLCVALRALNQRVLELPEDLVAAWLRGVFDGDGYVRNQPTAPQITISAWHSTANRKIRDALLRLGIPTSMSRCASEGRDGNIVITGTMQVRRFIHRIYSEHPQKRSALNCMIDELRTRDGSSSRLDSIPVGGALRHARLSLGMGQRAFRRGHVVSAYERRLNAPSRVSLQSVVEEMETWREARDLPVTESFGLVRDLAHSAVLWARIESVEPIQAGQPVYDLCLDRNHNFIASRLFTHNCIIFIDEIDAVGRHRGAGLGGGHDEREQTLNQLLVEMDGFDSNEGVIMIAATNRPDVLDPALLRPGRFDRQIVVDYPDVRGREGILRVHSRRIPLADDVDLAQIARSTPGLAGADLANLVNEAALLAARRNRKKVTARDFEDSKDKVMLGMERKSLVMTEDERRITAYHEAGHALVGLLQPGVDPVDKVTIIPRGRALGVTSYVPSEERHNRSKDDLIRRLCTSMGGRAAEYLIFSHFTTGAANDIEQATGLARRMVCEFGMSDRLGPLAFGKKEEMVFLGREISSHKDYSEQTAVAIDEEVRSMVEGAFSQALELLRKNIDKLHLIAGCLLEREVLDREEMDKLMRGEKLDPPKAVVEPELPETSRGAEAPRAGEGIEPFAPPAPRPAGA